MAFIFYFEIVAAEDSIRSFGLTPRCHACCLLLPFHAKSIEITLYEADTLQGEAPITDCHCAYNSVVRTGPNLPLRREQHLAPSQLILFSTTSDQCFLAARRM